MHFRSAGKRPLSSWSRRASPSTAAAVAAAAQRYGLSSQEARVLRNVIDVGGAPLAADALNVSLATVRTHLARVFDKTGARSQGALIKLLQEMEIPFRTPAGGME